MIYTFYNEDYLVYKKWLEYCERRFHLKRTWTQKILLFTYDVNYIFYWKMFSFVTSLVQTPAGHFLLISDMLIASEILCLWLIGFLLIMQWS